MHTGTTAIRSTAMYRSSLVALLLAGACSASSPGSTPSTSNAVGYSFTITADTSEQDIALLNQIGSTCDKEPKTEDRLKCVTHRLAKEQDTGRLVGVSVQAWM